MCLYQQNGFFSSFIIPRWQNEFPYWRCTSVHFHLDFIECYLHFSKQFDIHSNLIKMIFFLWINFVQFHRDCGFTRTCIFNVEELTIEQWAAIFCWKLRAFLIKWNVNSSMEKNWKISWKTAEIEEIHFSSSGKIVFINTKWTLYYDNITKWSPTQWMNDVWVNKSAVNECNKFFFWQLTDIIAPTWITRVQFTSTKLINICDPHIGNHSDCVITFTEWFKHLSKFIFNFFLPIRFELILLNVKNWNE